MIREPPTQRLGERRNLAHEITAGELRNFVYLLVAPSGRPTVADLRATRMATNKPNRRNPAGWDTAIHLGFSEDSVV